MADNETIEILTDVPDGTTGSGLDAYMATINKGPEIQTQEPEESAEAVVPTDTRAGSDQSDVGVDPSRLDKLEQRFNDAQQHIGVLEGENKSLREILTQSPALQGGGEPADEAEPDPLNDPEIVDIYKRAYGDDSVHAEANLLMLKQMYKHLDQKYSGQNVAVEQDLENQRRMQAVQQNIFSGFQHAAATYGEPAEVLIRQYIQSSGQEGPLAEAIQANQYAVGSPQSVSDTVARLVWHTGQTQTEQPEGQPPNNPASRPTRSRTSTNTNDELTPTQQAAKAIVAHKGVTDSLPFMR